MSLIESFIVSSVGKRATAVSMVAVIAGFSASTFVAFNEYVDTKDTARDLVRLLSGSSDGSQTEQARLDSLKAAIDNVKKDLDSLKSFPPPTGSNVELSPLRAEVTSLASRLTLLETAISNSPERALSVPMLRKDHEILVKQLNDSVLSSKLDYERLWSMLMLLLTVIGTAIVGVSGWAFRSIITNKSSN